MKIKEIQNKESWEKFLSKIEEKTFLQSWNWGEFNQKMGHKIWRLGIFENSELLGVALVLKIKARRGTFLFVPHGPLVYSENLETQTINDKPQRPASPQTESPNIKFQILNILLNELEKLSKQEKASFVRIAPIWERNEKNAKIFKDLNFRQAPIHMHPELSWQLDISPPEEELLMNMRKTTRYLIKKAKKNHGISIKQSSDPEDLEIFNQIYEQTAKRHRFAPFSLKYVKTQFEAFLPDNQIRLFLGEDNGKTIVASVAVFWQGISFYHHGASLPSDEPVSYLSQWEIIKEAKKQGCRAHNFWGIVDPASLSPEEVKKHPWQGLTLFKKGFGGYEKPYVRTQDYIVSKKYWRNFLIESIRKKIRRL